MTTQQAVQTREETILHHRERLNDVLIHIQENLDAPLTVETLASVAGFSPFYFHRIFAAYLRETTSDYVRRIRLDWAARRLILQQRTGDTDRVGRRLRDACRIWPGIQEALPGQPPHLPQAAAPQSLPEQLGASSAAA